MSLWSESTPNTAFVSSLASNDFKHIVGFQGIHDQFQNLNHKINSLLL